MTSTRSPLGCKVCLYTLTCLNRAEKNCSQEQGDSCLSWWESLTGFYTILPVPKAECHSGIRWRDKPNCSRQEGLTTPYSPKAESGFPLQLPLHPLILHTFPNSIVYCIHLPIFWQWQGAQRPHVYEHRENHCVFSSMDHAVLPLPWRLSPLGSQAQPH